MRYLLHFEHRYCDVQPGVQWTEADTKVREHRCPACRSPLMPKRIEDLSRIRGLRVGGGKPPQGDTNTLDKPLPSTQLTD